MSWAPISESELLDEINDGWSRMTPAEKRLWEAIRIDPEKWQQPPYGDEGGGFWVVAVIGNSVMWYNDIEDGFNISNFEKYGVINEYLCNQDDLDLAVRRILNVIRGDLPSKPSS